MEKIKSYLDKNPQAGDTIDGITTWWLEPGKTQPTAQQVANTLEILTGKGLVRKRRVHGGATLYRKRRRGRCLKV